VAALVSGVAVKGRLWRCSTVGAVVKGEVEDGGRCGRTLVSAVEGKGRIRGQYRWWSR
jgi:hypothetical protein